MSFFDSLVSGLTGGIFNLGSSFLTNMMNRSNMEWEAKNRFGWMAQSAQSAGLSPLAVVGSGGGGGTPGFTPPDLSGMGQSMGRSTSRQDEEDVRQKSQLENALIASQIGESDARRHLYLSEARRYDSPGTPLVHHSLDASLTGTHEITPGRSVAPSSLDKSVTAARPNPWWETVQLSPGLEAHIPQATGFPPDQVINGMNWGEWMGFLQHNVNEYGPGWLKKYFDWRIGLGGYQPPGGSSGSSGSYGSSVMVP